MNFKNMHARVQAYVNDTSAATLAIIKGTLNLKAQEIMRRSLWTWSIRERTITTVSGTQEYYLGSDVDKTLSVYQQNSPTQLKRVFIGDFDRLIPKPTAQGDPKFYSFVEEDRVLAQPTATGYVIASSDSNEDVTGQTGATMVTIAGIAGGIDRIENLSLSALNVLSSANSYTKLYAITADIAAVGTLRFTQQTVGTVLLQLYPTETERTFKKIKLYPIPNGARTIYVRYQALQPNLINDSDVLIAPNQFSECVVEMAIGDILLKQGDSKAVSHVQLGEKILSEMMRNEDLMWDYSPSIRMQDSGLPFIDSSYPFSYY